MVDFKYAESYLQDSVDKQLHIEFDSGTITNEELHSENFELCESLCSGGVLRFGCCEASSIKFKISNIFTPLKGKWLAVTETLGGNTDVSFPFGKYKAFSDKPTADRRYREITAYDAMYDINNAEVSAWYNRILPNEDSTVTMKEFRCSFLDYMGIEYEDVTLANDDMVIAKTIEPTTLSGNVVITAICEINGCFGHIGRTGKFQYIFLKEMVEGLYPSNTLYPRDDLYPASPLNAELISSGCYISAEYEDFKTARIDKLQIRQEEGDVGCIYGTGSNCYIVQDNFLVYGKSAEELETIAANLYSIICKVWYLPAHVEAKGNPCLEVGDGIRLRTKYEIIYTYILQRTLKGIQALRDTYDAEGEQYQSVDVNSTQEQIIQLKGKTNKLTRTLEETRSEIIDMEKGLSSRITQNAESITAEVRRAINREVELAAAININAENINLKVNKNNIISEINQTAEKITISAQKIDLVGLVEADELVSKFATINTLIATEATLESLIADKASVSSLNALSATVTNLATEKLSASEFTADNISAMNITVKSANVSGGFDASKITSGQISADRIDVSGLIASNTFRGAAITVQALYALSGITVSGAACSWKTAQVINSSGEVTEIKYLGA